MQEQESIFRKVSLDRLASPERLDQMMEATTPRGWLALGGVALLLLAAVGWGFTGSIPEKLPGQGILVNSGGVFEVVPLEGGRVMEVAVRVGDAVTEGQVIARVAQPALSAQLREAQARLGAQRAEVARLGGAVGREQSVQSAYDAQQRANLEASIRASEQTLAFLAQKMESQERLVRDGLLTQQVLAATRQEHRQAQEEVRQARARIKELEVERTAVRERSAGEVQGAGARLGEMEREVGRLRDELARSSAVVTPYTGRILEIMTEQGNIVEGGQPVARLDPEGVTTGALEAVVYVGSEAGKKIRPGMTIQISPSTVREEEHGYMLGRVTYVSDFPATAQGMLRVLKNDQLVTALAGGGTPYEVRAALSRDPRTVSGYRWSSPKGPPVQVRSGTLAHAQVIVDRVRPVELALPSLRADR